MSADSDKLRNSFAAQLSSFDDRLASKADDLKMLAEIQDGIGRLLEASGGNEAEIRRTLQERYESGQLRKETFQLVKSMLDRYVTEQVPTSMQQIEKASQVAPVSAGEEEPANDDQFTTTDVLATDVIDTDDPDERVQVGSVLRDRFMLQERVTGGSMGVVYKALDRRLAEAGSETPWVAIKVLSPQLSHNGNALRALQQEAAKSRCLTHSNIVRFIDFDRDEDLYFIVMEWLEGRTLADILDSPDSRSIDFEQSFRIVRQIGRALEYAHRCGIVHADVKPGNIMMMPNGEAKLFDFGVARVQQQQAEDESFDPGILGALTPAYSSMQVLTGEDPVPSDDVFSLACLLYRLIAGYRVFGPRNAAEASQEGMSPQPLPGLSEAQWAAVRKALSYSRVTRFASVTELLAALDGIKMEAPDPALRVSDTMALDVGRHAEFDDSGGSLRWLIALIALLGLLGVAGYQFGIFVKILDQLNLPQAGIETLPELNDDAPAPFEDGPGEDSLVDTALPLEEAVVPFEEISSRKEAPASALEARADAIDEENLPPELREAPPFVPEPGQETRVIDFSTLPPADVEVPIYPGSSNAVLRSVTLREDGEPFIVDFVRSGPVDLPLMLRIEEVGFSGNRSPWRTGHYQISDGGMIEFRPGQDRARLTLSMANDTLREADQQSTLRVREADSTSVEFAIIEVVLEDDDQRRFEAQLQPNTIAFATSQVSVLERDPAVQIDLVRFNPDNSSLVVDFRVADVTATAGEDYFPPTNNTIVFGPGQRSARILIPLVQDSAYEGDEAFVVELSGSETSSDADIHYRVAVMLRDDDRR